jgi:hypothetical protein
VLRARDWLTHAPIVTSEDRNMQLLGLAWSGADAAGMKGFLTSILAAQQPDGGWKQHDGLGTDAYATGESLYALAKGGVPPSDPRYMKGVQYLLKTQRARMVRGASKAVAQSSRRSSRAASRMRVTSGSASGPPAGRRWRSRRQLTPPRER